MIFFIPISLDGISSCYSGSKQILRYMDSIDEILQNEK